MNGQKSTIPLGPLMGNFDLVRKKCFTDYEKISFFVPSGRSGRGILLR